MALREATRLFDRRVWFLTYGQVLMSLGRGVLMPFATLYFYHEKGFPLTAIGLALAVAFPLGSLAGLVWGAVADRVGRKPLMMAGFGGQAIATVSLAFVESVAAYFVVIVFNSVAIAAWGPSSRAMVADVTPSDRRTRAFGLLYMANNLGLSMGLLLGGVMAAFFPYRALFFAEAAGAALFLVVVLLFVQESHRPRAQERAPVGPLAKLRAHLLDLATPARDPLFVLFAATTVLAGLGWAQFYITYTPYLKDFLGTSDAWLGAVLAVNTVMVVAFQVPLAAWAERRRRTTVLVVGTHLLAWSLLLTWAAGRLPEVALPLMVVAVFVMTVGEIVNAPVTSALTAGLAKDETRFGKYMARRT